MVANLFLPKQIRFGEESLNEIGELAKQLKMTHLFILTGSLMRKAPYYQQLMSSIQSNDLTATFYGPVHGEPSTLQVNEALRMLIESKADGVVAIGGGSVIDLAKAVSVFAKNKEISYDQLVNMDHLKRLPLIAVPTTAGTGSEVSKVMVITDIQNNVKKNPAHSQLIPDVAILDPMLTISVPKSITAFTGMDALTHALEAYLSTKATILSDFYALEAIRILSKWLPRAYDNEEDVEARGKVLLGSCYAGIAFSNSSTNLTHATARALGARFQIPHGLSVALLLPFVLEYSLKSCIDRFKTIVEAWQGSGSINESFDGTELLQLVKSFNEKFHIKEHALHYLANEQDFMKQLPLLIQASLSGNGINTNRQIPKEKDVEIIFNKLITSLHET